MLLTTIRTGSFSKAANELNCTQSAVTQTINALEKELNCKILKRDHSGISLSHLGEALLPAILDADKSLRTLMEQATIISQGKSLPIRIGAYSSIANTWLPKLLPEYQTTHPDVIFDIRVGADTLSDWLLKGEIDLALGDINRMRAFRSYPLMEDPYYAVLSPKYADSFPKSITQKKLFKLPFIMAPMNALDKYFTYVPQNKIRVKCDDDYTLLSMVEQGLGVKAMPKLSLSHLTHNVFISKLTPQVSRTLGITLPNKPTKVIQDFASGCFFLIPPISLNGPYVS